MSIFVIVLTVASIIDANPVKFAANPLLLRSAPSNLADGSVWPQPQLIRYGKASFPISPSSLQLLTVGVQCDIITEAVKSYKSIIFPTKSLPAGEEQGGDRGQFTALNILLNGPCEKYPYYGMNEDCK